MKKQICQSEGSIVLVHLNKRKFPDYIYTCIEQIRIFNLNEKIILAVNESCNEIDIVRLENLKCQLIMIESLKRSFMHWIYKIFFRGRMTTERYFILEEIMRTFNLKNVIHLENDVMVYTNLSELLVKLERVYDVAALTRDNDKRCIGGILYIKDYKILSKYCRYIVLHFNNYKLNDMDTLSKLAYKYKLDYLPVINSQYLTNNKLMYLENGKTRMILNNKLYFQNEEVFDGIFDAAAIGQYIGGIDKIHAEGNTRGYINPDACYNVEKIKLKWEESNGLYCPIVFFGKKRVLVYNLHIHSKELYKYKSDNLEEAVEIIEFLNNSKDYVS